MPIDITGLATGRSFPLEFSAMRDAPARRVPCTIGVSEVKISLGSRDPAVIEDRTRAVELHVRRVFDAIRSGPRKLDFEEICAMTESVYWLYVETHRREPGTPEQWAAFKAVNRAIKEGRITDAPTIAPGFANDQALAEKLFGSDLTSGINALPASKPTLISLEQRFGALADWTLAHHCVGLVLPEDRERLLLQVHRAAELAAFCLKKYGVGDYSDDPAAVSFPRLKRKPSPAPRAKAASGASLLAMFESWVLEAKPARKTVSEYRRHVTAFTAFVKSDDAGGIEPEDVIRWKDHLLEIGNSAKTVNDSKLAALRRVYTWGMKNRLVAANPTDGISVDHRARAGDRMREHDVNEAAVLLRESSKSTRASIRWIPLLCAATGARVSEMTQLRAEDVIEVEGHPAFRITEEAGTVKTSDSARVVPMHPVIVEAGFLTFVQGKSGPLFHGVKRRKEDAVRSSASIVAKNVAAWVHEVAQEHGLKIGRKYRKDPNHAWRHRLTSLMIEADVPERVYDAITGHGSNKVSRRYGAVPFKTMRDAVLRIPAERIAPPVRTAKCHR